jgi:hypothetical protein
LAVAGSVTVVASTGAAVASVAPGPTRSLAVVVVAELVRRIGTVVVNLGNQGRVDRTPSALGPPDAGVPAIAASGLG